MLKGLDRCSKQTRFCEINQKTTVGGFSTGTWRGLKSNQDRYQVSSRESLVSLPVALERLLLERLYFMNADFPMTSPFGLVLL